MADAWISSPTFAYKKGSSRRPTILHLNGEASDAQSAPKSSDFYHDIRFNVPLDVTPHAGADEALPAQPLPRGQPTGTVPSEGAAAIMQTNGFHLAWSGISAPTHSPTTANTHPEDGSAASSRRTPSPAEPAAKSLTDEEPSRLMAQMWGCLDRFLAASPGKRDLTVNRSAMTGLSVTKDSNEVYFNTAFLTAHVSVINAILQLCQEAVAAEAEVSEDKDQTWPIPFDRPLRITSKYPPGLPHPTGPPGAPATSIPDLGSEANLDAQKDKSKSVQPDYYLVYGHVEDPSIRAHSAPAGAGDSLPIIVGTLESKPKMNFDAAQEWVQPRRDPLALKTPAPSSGANASRSQDLSNALRSTRSQRTVPAMSSTPSSGGGMLRPSASQSKNSNLKGFNVHEWNQKLSLQASSYSYLHDTPCGLLVGDWGRMLVLWELHRLSPADTLVKQSGNASRRESFALCFARQAIYSFVPDAEAFPETGEDPDWVASRLSRPRNGTSDGSSSSTEAEGANLQFHSRPATIWGAVHWCLYACFVKFSRGLPSTSAERDVAALTEMVDTTLTLQAERSSANVKAGQRRGASVKVGQRRGGGRNKTYRSQSGSTQVQQTRARLHTTSALCGSFGFLPIIGALAVFPAPFAFGLHANLYRCMPPPNRRNPGWCRRTFEGTGKATRASWPGTVFSSALAEAKMVVKVHRAPLSEADKFDGGGHQCAPPLRALQAGEWFDWSSDEGIAIAKSVKARTMRELRAYSQLRSLQGTALPILVGVAPPEFAPKSLSWKLVLENTGSSLSSIAEHWPAVYVEWEVDIRTQVMAAVEACHAFGVVHGDLHAANIMASWSEAEAEPVPEQAGIGNTKQKRMPCAERSACGDVRGRSPDRSRRSIDSGISLRGSQTSDGPSSPSTSLTRSFQALSSSPIREMMPSRRQCAESTESLVDSGDVKTSGAEAPTKKLRIALVDWSSAQVFRLGRGRTPPAEALEYELARVAEVLDQLLSWAAARA